MGRPTSVKDVDQTEAVQKIADFLKKSGKVKVPEWADLVKLARFKELAPIDPDWYYTRAASIARRLYIRNPAGKLLFYILLCLDKGKRSFNESNMLNFVFTGITNF